MEKECFNPIAAVPFAVVRLRNTVLVMTKTKLSDPYLLQFFIRFYQASPFISIKVAA